MAIFIVGEFGCKVHLSRTTDWNIGFAVGAHDRFVY